MPRRPAPKLVLAVLALGAALSALAAPAAAIEPTKDIVYVYVNHVRAEISDSNDTAVIWIGGVQEDSDQVTTVDFSTRAASGAACDRYAQLMMAKPGRYRLTIHPRRSSYARPTCSLSLVDGAD